LEARWAILFKELGITAHYEMETFALHGGCYLPDFYLPQVRMWAEVKPIEFTVTEKQKCKELVDATGHPCLLLVGPPDFKTYWAVHSADREGLDNLPEGGIRYETDYLLDIDSHLRRYYRDEHRFYGCCGGYYSTEMEFTPDYRRAVHLSRSSRFGEEAA
jgi:hypothetical protein